MFNLNAMEPKPSAKAIRKRETSRPKPPLVGTRISVLWEAENMQWFSGFVQRFDDTDATHRILYDDCDAQWHDLSQFQWKVLRSPQHTNLKRARLEGDDGIAMSDSLSDDASADTEVPDATKGASLHVGTRISVMWEAERRWFSGGVQRFDGTDATHRVLYDDGDEKWHELSKFQWKVLRSPQQKKRARLEGDGIVTSDSLSDASADTEEMSSDARQGASPHASARLLARPAARASASWRSSGSVCGVSAHASSSSVSRQREAKTITEPNALRRWASAPF